MSKQEKIYELVNGYFTEEVPAKVDGIHIENEFKGGSECSNLYEEVYALKAKINDRLSTDEDEDLEHLIDCMESINRIIALKMYTYGAKIGN